MKQLQDNTMGKKQEEKDVKFGSFKSRGRGDFTRY